MPYCNNCGEEVSSGQQYCSNCGEPVGSRSRDDQQRRGSQDGDQRAGGAEQNQAGGWGEDDQAGGGGWNEETAEQGGWDGDQATRQRGGQSGRGPPAEGRGGGGGPPPGQGAQAPRPYPEIPRKSAIDTISESTNWLLSVPILLGLFVAVRVVSALASVAPAGLSVILTIAGFLAAILVAGMSYVYAENKLRDEPSDPETAASIVRDQFLPFLVVFIVYSIAVVIGLALLIIPGLYIGARLFPALPACILDKYSISDSLSIGWDIGGENILKLLGIFLLYVIPSAFVSIVGAVGAGLSGNLAFLLITAPILAFIEAVSQLSVGRVYIENY